MPLLQSAETDSSPAKPADWHAVFYAKKTPKTPPYPDLAPKSFMLVDGLSSPSPAGFLLFLASAMAFPPPRICYGTELWLLANATQGATDCANPPMTIATSADRLESTQPWRCLWSQSSRLPLSQVPHAYRTVCRARAFKAPLRRYKPQDYKVVTGSLENLSHSPSSEPHAIKPEQAKQNCDVICLPGLLAKGFMKFTLPFIAVMAATASAAAVDLTKRDSPLSVTLTRVEDSKVKVALTNTADTGYNLMTKETFLDDAPADKLVVSSKSARAPFTGIYQRLATSDLPEEVFRTIEAGETIEVEVELAEIYELAESGAYDVSAAGSFLYAPLNSTELTGEVLPFASEHISVDVVYEKAHTVGKAIDRLQKRTVVQSDCTGTRLSTVQNALRSCSSLASAAATAATSGNAARFSTFFGNSNRNTVAARFRAVANDCGSTNSGNTRTYCTDIYGACSGGVLAYALPALNYIAYCPSFFNQLPPRSGSCYAQDQATTVLHESTHAPGVYSPGTVDNAYGYAASTRLSASQALLNADSYALFADSVNKNC
ncbi:hypothetical protein Q7P37_009079 [Cladosporium fusiforme]